ncbi:MAG: hypothetical protein RL199_2464, partial [Pseudomonadota bacterium]
MTRPPLLIRTVLSALGVLGLLVSAPLRVRAEAPAVSPVVESEPAAEGAPPAVTGSAPAVATPPSASSASASPK